MTIRSNELGEKTIGPIAPGFVKLRFTRRRIMHLSISKYSLARRVRGRGLRQPVQFAAPSENLFLSWKISSCLKNLACGFRKMNRRRSVTRPQTKTPQTGKSLARVEQPFPREGVSPAQLVPCPRWTICGHTYGTDRARGELTVGGHGYSTMKNLELKQPRIGCRRMPRERTCRRA